MYERCKLTYFEGRSDELKFDTPPALAARRGSVPTQTSEYKTWGFVKFRQFAAVTKKKERKTLLLWLTTCHS